MCLRTNVLLHLLSNMETLRTIIRAFLAMTCGRTSGSALNNDCRLSSTVAPSSSQLVPQRPLRARSLMMLVFRASINCPTDQYSEGSWIVKVLKDTEDIISVE
jgi:hypothetical protein